MTIARGDVRLNGDEKVAPQCRVIIGENPLGDGSCSGAHASGVETCRLNQATSSVAYTCWQAGADKAWSAPEMQ